MTFDEAIARQPQWVQLWILWMVGITLATFAILLFSKATRRDALVLLLVNLANALFMQWLYARLGYVRLLGLSHIIFWTPLVLYLWRRLGDSRIARRSGSSSGFCW